MANLAYTPEEIYGVQVETLGTKDEAGTRIIRSKVWGSTGTLNGADKALTLSTFTWGRDWLPVEPDAGVPWSFSTINALNAGVEIVT